jgi:phosphoglycerate dehydrogenase-like enzyme/predicted dehydrogenase
VKKIPPEISVIRPIRALVIGAGPAAVAMHLPVLAQLRAAGELQFTLVCDIESGRATAAQRKFGFLEAATDAIGALERSDIDAVYIFGSAQMHYEYGMKALKCGKHLFVEKPVAPSYEQAREMAQAALSHGVVAVGGHNRRFYQSLAAVRARAGKAGWRSAEVVFHKPEYGKPVPFGAQSWLSANGIHALDAMVFMMGGLPEQLTAFAGDPGTAVASVFSALMRWRNGAQGVFLCNNSAGARREEYVFHGIAETCRVTETGLTVEQDDVASNTRLAVLGDGVGAEHDAFLRAIRTGIEPVHSILAIAPSLRLAELIERGFSGRVEMPAAPPAGGTLQPEIAQSILIDRPLELMSALTQLLAHYRFVSRDEVHASPELRPDIVAAVLARESAELDSEILGKLPRLRVVGVIGLSIARYEPEALLARGITVVNASDAYAESVAEFALGLTILGRRRAFTSHGVMRAGGWGTDAGSAGLAGRLHRLLRRTRPALAAAGVESFLLTAWRKTSRSKRRALIGRSTVSRDLKGTVVGLVGWGANARAFTAHLVRAQAQILVYSEHAAAAEIVAAGAVPASLNEVLAADVVSLHRGLTANTRHSLGAAELAKLRPGAVLINVARGALTDPHALLARLKRGDIFACLDTYDEEPLDASHPLRKLKNVFLTPHIAGGSPDMRAAAAEEVMRKITAHLEGKTVGSISAERLRTMT